LVLAVWALDRGAVFAQWRGCLPGALSRSQEPRDREKSTTTLIRRCNGNGLSARRRIRVVASHGAPREWCFEQRRAAVFWHERRARARMRVALTERHSDFLVRRTPPVEVFDLGTTGTCVVENSWGSSSR
jgi:hypothetical protein